jgi:hypothetical protein
MSHFRKGAAPVSVLLALGPTCVWAHFGRGPLARGRITEAWPGLGGQRRGKGIGWAASHDVPECHTLGDCSEAILTRSLWVPSSHSFSAFRGCDMPTGPIADAFSRSVIREHDGGGSRTGCGRRDRLGGKPNASLDTGASALRGGGSIPAASEPRAESWCSFPDNHQKNARTIRRKANSESGCATYRPLWDQPVQGKSICPVPGSLRASDARSWQDTPPATFIQTSHGSAGEVDGHDQPSEQRPFL